VPRSSTVGRTAATNRLGLELLEDRQMLAGSPWQNPVLPLDVDHDSRVANQDVIAIFATIMKDGPRTLPPLPPGTIPQFYYDVTGDNRVNASDAAQIFHRLLRKPQVQVSTLLPYTIDLTPQVTVTATGSTATDGCTVALDVDLDGDGRFNSPGELGQTTSSLVNGTAVFDMNPGLLPSADDKTYTTKIRARVRDSVGIECFSPIKSLEVDTTTSSVLSDYVHAPDSHYSYDASRAPVVGPGFKMYVVDMKSQEWRPEESSKPVWQHWLQIIVPDGEVGSTALLFVSSGSTSANPPGSPDARALAVALATHSVAVYLPTVPNQQLTFVGDTFGPREEDEIIAYSYRQFMDHYQEEGAQTWPVLLAMVKSAVRAMDTAQAVVPDKTGHEITDFIVTGYSKRGWTTWLTPEVDDRVKAIIPGVFEMLNQGPELHHHYGALGHFSEEIQDYTNLGIFEDIDTPAGRALGKIVDPYSYLSNPNYEIPKLMLVSSGDQFFVSDSAQFYFHDLPGDDNYIRYIPNTGHDLGMAFGNPAAILSTATFFNAVANDLPLPKFSWTIGVDQSIRVQTGARDIDKPDQVLLWQATNPDTRDFRQFYVPATVLWESTKLTDQGGGVYVGNTPIPTSGATGYFIELTYKSPIDGNPYVFTTEIRVNTKMPLVGWLANEPAAPLADLNSITGSIMVSATGPPIPLTAVVANVGPPADAEDTAAPKVDPAPAASDVAVKEGDSYPAAVDAVLDESADEVLV
jgi:PhoPQ-activated pathogenicity-related protein